MNTLKFVSTFNLIIKKSKFIGFAYRVDDEERVSLKYLVENKYSTDIVDRKGTKCDLNDSYVGAYKDSYDKTN